MGDWASVVPNFAPNFTVAKMVDAAMDSGCIEFSNGDYGRPLLGASDAGAALVLLTDLRLRTDAGSPGSCQTVLLPGIFTPFRRFAEIVRAEAVNSAQCAAVLVPQTGTTPSFLSVRCESAKLSALGFEPDPAAVEAGL